MKFERKWASEIILASVFQNSDETYKSEIFVILVPTYKACKLTTESSTGNAIMESL